MRRKNRKCLAIAMAGALILSMTGEISPVSEAASKKASVKLSSTSLTVQKGQTKKLKVKKTGISKVKKIVWSSGNKKVVTISKKGVVKGVKAGTASVSAKVTYLAKGSKKYKTCVKKCKVKVKAKQNVTPWPTLEPTATPAVYGTVGEVSTYDKEKSNYSLTVDASDEVHEISDMLYGVFIEDINFAADGGLYAEMVQNRSFEFTKLASGDEKHAWSDVGKVSAKVKTDDAKGCLNVNNPNYMVIENKSSSFSGIQNKGFLDGMAVSKDATYDFSIYAKGLDGYTGEIAVDIMNKDKSVASGKITEVSSGWKKYELTLKSSVTAYENVSLRITIPKGKVAVDMVSLFPQDTFKGRKNGLRKDLAEKLEELNPAFLRFPGGCVVEGVSLSTAYDWKDSIGVDESGNPLEFNGTYGDVATRRQGQNIWTDENATNDSYPSYMTYGLGFYEYFQLAEDIGAVGVPVVNCGLCCQMQGNGSGPAIDSDEFKQYVQDALDLVEFCRGDETTKWGKIRIAMGHKEPFALKYVGIGNEQQGSDFYKRYEKFVEAFDKAKKENPSLYGDIELMYTAGVDDGDSGRDVYMSAYEEASSWLKAHPDKTILDYAGAIDHHYYNSPDWFLSHTDYYDPENYSRDTEHMTTAKYGGGMNVFLGEYAAQSNTWQAALSEAAYMTGLERNGDIVKMAAYAPLFGNLTALHWAPDLIWFNNHTVTCSVNYYVQKIFAKNAGTALLGTNFTRTDVKEEMFSGKIGVGTWNTAAKFDNVKITDNETGETLAEDKFSDGSVSGRWEKVSDGNFKVKNGKLVQSDTTTNIDSFSNTGTVMYFGNPNWGNYTFTVEAQKTAGSEGFLIPFSVIDEDNNYFWNIGGWNNTISCLQRVSNGTKSDKIGETVKNCNIREGETYKLKVVVNNNNVKCYINNELYVDYNIGKDSTSDCYQVVSTDSSKDVIIKMVNVSGYEKTVAINIENAVNINEVAECNVTSGRSLKEDNILGKEEAVTLKRFDVKGIKSEFNYTVPKYSVVVLRVQRE